MAQIETKGKKQQRNKMTLTKVSMLVGILVGISTLVVNFADFSTEPTSIHVDNHPTIVNNVPGGEDLVGSEEAESPVTESDHSSKRIVVVSPFENITTTRLDIGVPMNYSDEQKIIERYSEVGREILEDVIVDIPDVAVVSRKDLQAIMEELNLQQSGLVSRSTALKLGQLLGANGIVLGSLMSVNESIYEKTVYGNELKTTTVNASIRVRLIDVETGQITLSEIVDGQEVFTELREGASTEDGTVYNVIRDALNQLRENQAFKNSFRLRQQG